MSVHPTPDTGFIKRFCPCDLAKITASRPWLSTCIGVAIAIAGVVSMILSQSVGGAIGYALFGLTLFYQQFCNEERQITDLTKQMQDSTQQLRSKQEEIATLTAQLKSMEQNSREMHEQFQEVVGRLGQVQQALRGDAQSLQQSRNVQAQGNLSLEEVSRKTAEQIAALKQQADAFGRRAAQLQQQRLQFQPQMNLISRASTNLQTSASNWLQTIQGITQNFANILQTFALERQSWKSSTDTIIEENKRLGSQLRNLQSMLDKGQITANQLQEENRLIDANRAKLAQEATRLEQAKVALAAEATRLEQNNTKLTQLLPALQQLTDRLPRSPPTLPRKPSFGDAVRALKQSPLLNFGRASASPDTPPLHLGPRRSTVGDSPLTNSRTLAPSPVSTRRPSEEIALPAFNTPFLETMRLVRKPSGTDEQK